MGLSRNIGTFKALFFFPLIFFFFFFGSTPKVTPGFQHLAGRGWGWEKEQGQEEKGRMSLLTKPPTGPRLHNVFLKIKFLIMLWAVKLRFRKWGETETNVGSIYLFPDLHQFEFSIREKTSLGLKNVKFKKGRQTRERIRVTGEGGGKEKPLDRERSARGSCSSPSQLQGPRGGRPGLKARVPGGPDLQLAIFDPKSRRMVFTL